MPTEKLQTVPFHRNGAEIDLAVRTLAGSEPGLVWLGGFRSDMDGTKAEALAGFAADRGLANLRFDYSGHGMSGGHFGDGTISVWVEESLHVIRHCTSGPQILVGSSMGGWIALRLVEELQKSGEAGRVAGLVLIAPAPDFTSRLMLPSFTEEQKEALQTEGRILEPSQYSDEPNVITRALIEDGERNTVLGRGLAVRAPVRILQGMNDPDVPHDHALALVSDLASDDVTITLIRDGDHRLSRPQDILLLKRTVETILADIG